MKRLAVCFDGTWNDAETQAADTNVARISRAIHANATTGGVLQCVLYLRGVGTSGLRAEVVVEGATGLGVDENIRSAYMFLAQNYVPGDEVFLFGFSRGAFTARSTAGLINACGLLKRQKLGDLGRAWQYYRTPKPHSPVEFVRRTGTESHVDVRIKFLGVWDTVGALGIPGTLFSLANQDLHGFHDTGPSPVIIHGCQALAVDEHRGDFVPTLWTGDPIPGTSIEQVWFAGAHSDVGGGYATRTLADIPLVWMADKAEANGLALDWSCLPDRNTLQPLAPMHDSSTGVFIKDKLMPTLRRICEHDVAVPFYERLYEVRNVDPRSMQVLGNYQCLALAFINYKDGVFSYAHKMWSKSSDGSCHYEDVTSKKVGNHGACVRDLDAGFGLAIGTTRMTKANIDYQHSIFRTIDTTTRQVGETAACVRPRASALVYTPSKLKMGA